MAELDVTTPLRDENERRPIFPTVSLRPDVAHPRDLERPEAIHVRAHGLHLGQCAERDRENLVESILLRLGVSGLAGIQRLAVGDGVEPLHEAFVRLAVLGLVGVVGVSVEAPCGDAAERGVGAVAREEEIPALGGVHTKWTLEVVDAEGTSTVWDDEFEWSLV
jgi:hypothetical protein